MSRVLATLIAFVFSFFLTSCAAAPRTTTEQERATATKTLTAIRIAVNVARADGKVHDQDYERTMAVIAQLQQEIADSATVPLDVGDVLLRVGDLATAWAVAQKEGK